ncbi:helix-turn-helix transcriptional regulator [Christiangramia fulva]|uniref:Helix-turn-helix transcriptional regulator n=1 Tax=Christiangramia fulva TaxID=2126553 RepID=A0A2R3Z9K3_9FLAO|nr:LuxR C-terminal-related transcriptional regulator [Christiangramia fulva]AVR46937.1 helix-turn-helix transcriptional regulator [Christiangramia fulva]
MERKQLLIISRNVDLVESIKEKTITQYEITWEKSVHVGYSLALNLLPDVIFFDKTCYNRTSDFKNLRNFKATHFLTKSYLIVYAGKEEIAVLKRKYQNVIDAIIQEKTGTEVIADILRKAIKTRPQNLNYWYECFMGLFNIIGKPVVLLQQDKIIAMNDNFRQTFKIDGESSLRLTDLVNIENKAKVKSSLRNFARGKHMKAVTSTSLLIQNEKIRDARISFSKLSRDIHDQFIMLIDFMGEEQVITEKVGSNSREVQKCFEENSEMTDFSFTKREKEIIGLLCKGYKTREISKALCISPKTIEKHRSNIIKRTNSETILESVVYAIHHNMLDTSPS